MKKLVLLLTVLICFLKPAPVRADDGGFWDMIWHWDLKFSGYGTDFHLLCLTATGERVNCEEWFKKIGHNPFAIEALPHSFDSFAALKHEVNFRVSLMHSYGLRIPNEVLAPSDTNTNDTSKVWALKLMGVYYYRINKRVDVGGGAGVIPVFGLSNGSVLRPIVTGSLVCGLGGAWFVRFEENYFGNTITAADLGHPTSTYSAGPKWAPSIALGVDFRRRSR